MADNNYITTEVTFKNITVSNGETLKVGEVLAQKGYEEAKKVARENLEKIKGENGYFSFILNEIQKMNIIKIEEKRTKFHNQAGLGQFAGLTTPQNLYKQYRIIKQQKEEIQEDLIKFQFLVNQLRSVVLGLPHMDYSVAINDAGHYYYVINNKDIDSFKVLAAERGRVTKNYLTTRTSQTRKEIRKAIALLQQTENVSYQLYHAKIISIHFDTMMNTIPLYSNGHSVPKVKWAGEVFEKHIQQTGEKDFEDIFLINAYNWSHFWDIASFWDDYHAAETPGKDLNNRSLQFATATQGGDWYQTQVKSFNRKKGKNFGSVNIVNKNNLQDIFSFWSHYTENIKNGNIDDRQLDEILSVLLSNQTIIDLGWHSLGAVRGLEF